MAEGRPPRKIGALIASGYPSIEELKDITKEGIREHCFDVEEVLKLLSKDRTDSQFQGKSERFCAKLHFDELKLDKEKILSKEPVNNFITYSHTGARHIEDPMTIQAAQGFILKPDTSGIFHSHIGEEMVIILNGVLEYRDILGNFFTLTEGDVIRLRSELFHEISSASEEPAEILAVWWGPSIRGSMLGIHDTGSIEQTTIYTRVRKVPGEKTLNIWDKTSQENLIGAYKYCFGIPEMIKHHVNSIGMMEDSLTNLLKRTPRFIDELLNKFLDPNSEVLVTLLNHMGIPNEKIIWRALDDEDWVQVLRKKDYISEVKFSGGVLSAEFKQLNATIPKLSEIELAKTDQESYDETTQSDRIYVVLEGGLHVQRTEHSKNDPTKIAASAGPGESLYLKPDVDWIIFPIRKESKFLEITVLPHANELEVDLRKDLRRYDEES